MSVKWWLISVCKAADFNLYWPHVITMYCTVHAVQLAECCILCSAHTVTPVLKLAASPIVPWNLKFLFRKQWRLMTARSTSQLTCLVLEWQHGWPKVGRCAAPYQLEISIFLEFSVIFPGINKFLTNRLHLPMNTALLLHVRPLCIAIFTDK